MHDILVLSAATLAAGFLRGVTGFGFALAAVPLYSLTMAPLQAIVVAQILQIAAAPTDFLQNRRSVDRRALGRLCGGALVFAPIGAVFATRLPADALRLAIAAIVLMGLAALMARVTIRDGKAPAVTAGALAGLLGGLAAMPGPPAVAYFLGRGTEKSVSRASLLLFFAFTASIALAALALESEVVDWGIGVSALAAYPSMLFGNWMGTRLFQRLGDGHYRVAALAVLFLSAALTGAKGIAGLI
ncbi:sulfite exporter TauE/SafE family protein [Paracoccus sp. Z330]|uniref:Probable membrane transporter protein n=1 Tax=Paracoccus onchidii TaxID=3017813 RepID=A0ABT4ZDG3_9RHOB|nr:sulfite exporter TauE/SafE family protein [Paracoccus onchidii]MDB6177320.1 sulfite exporter TauE/SafE family protein [Paracoccus onchidii]